MARDLDKDIFVFSDSVVAFYTDKRVNTAVKLLLDDGIVFAPDDNDWDRVETYYDAWIAARQTQVDEVRNLFQLWTRVWSKIPDGWQAVAADPKDDELSLDPDIRWDEAYFERHFRIHHNKVLTLWVTFGDKDELSEIEMAFDIRQGSRSSLKKHSTELKRRLVGWTFRDGAMRFVSDKKYRNGLDITKLCEEAGKALSEIDEFEW